MECHRQFIFEGETQLSSSAETYNRTKRIDTGYSGASATNGENIIILIYLFNL